MKVLVTAASRHGATMEIAQRIASELTASGLSVDVVPVEDVSTLTEFDAVVLGSAIYYGHWLKSAVRFAEVFLDDLSERSVWLFSSGPVEPEPESTSPTGDPAGSPLNGALKIRGHRVFAGDLDKSKLDLAERFVVRVIRGAYGDYRDWSEVRSWANTIASALARSDADRSSETVSSRTGVRDLGPSQVRTPVPTWRPDIERVLNQSTQVRADSRPDRAKEGPS